MFPNTNGDRVSELLEKNTAILEMLARNQVASGGGQHTKTVANFSTYTPLHGPGGIWGVNGLERDVVSAHVRPFGLASRLPMIPTVYTNPLYGILTGYTATSGSQPRISGTSCVIASEYKNRAASGATCGPKPRRTSWLASHCRARSA